MRSGGDRGDRKASGPTPIVCRALMAAGTPLFSTDASLVNETKSAMTFSRWHARFFASMECRRGHAGRGYPADRVSPGLSMLTLRVSMAPVPSPGAKLFGNREVESAHRLADSADLGSSGSGLLNRRPLRSQLSQSPTVGASRGDLRSAERRGQKTSGDPARTSATSPIGKRIPVNRNFAACQAGAIS